MVVPGTLPTEDVADRDDEKAHDEEPSADDHERGVVHCRTSPPVCQHGVLQNRQRSDPPPVGRAQTRLVTAPRLRPANHPKPDSGASGLRRSASRVWAVAVERPSDFRTCTTVRSSGPARRVVPMIAASGAALQAITFHGVMDRTAPCRRSDSEGSACDVGDEPVEVRVMPDRSGGAGRDAREARGRPATHSRTVVASRRRPRRPARCPLACHQARSLAGPAARARDQACALDDLAGRPEARGRRDRERRPLVWRRQPGEPADGARGVNPRAPWSSRRAAGGGRCAARLRSNPSNSTFPSFRTNLEAAYGASVAGTTCSLIRRISCMCKARTPPGVFLARSSSAVSPWRPIPRGPRRSPAPGS